MLLNIAGAGISAGQPAWTPAGTVLAIDFQTGLADLTGRHSVAMRAGGTSTLDSNGLASSGGPDGDAGLDISPDGVEIPDSDDFAFGSGDWCLEWYGNYTQPNRSGAMMRHWTGTNNRAWQIGINEANFSTGLLIITTSTTGQGGAGQDNMFVNNPERFNRANELRAKGFCHVVFNRSGTTRRVFFDGIAVSNEGGFTGSIFDASGPVVIGAQPGVTRWARINKGNALYTANFIPPTTIYQSV